jgi:hypothetical protein
LDRDHYGRQSPPCEDSGRKTDAVRFGAWLFGQVAVDGDKIIVRVDISSNEVFAGANQVQTRFFKLDGEKLTVQTPEISSAALPGKKIVGTNIFEREH